MIYRPLLRKLASIEALSEVEEKAIESLCGDVRVVERRKNIIVEGAKPDWVHLILSGWAARYNTLPDGTRRISAFLLPGDFCDIQATALTTMDHSITSISDCEVAFVPARLMDEVMRSTPPLTRAFWRMTLVDQAVLRQWLVNLGGRGAKASIACLLCELHARMKLVGLVTDGRMQLPLRQEDLADALGLTPVHVNRMLQELRAEHGITVGKGELHVPDAQALGVACGFSPTYLHLRNSSV